MLTVLTLVVRDGAGLREQVYMNKMRGLRYAAVMLLLVTACAHTSPERSTGADEAAGDGLLEVHFMDVGQGDGMLIRTPDGKNYLLDTGPSGARRQIFPYLEKLGITGLDGIIISHSHSDHAGGLYHFAGQFEIGTLYSSGFFHPSKTNQRALQRLLEMKVEHRKLKRGDAVQLGNKVTLKVLHPPARWKPREDQINDFSLIMKLSYGDIDFLLTGDAELAAENSVLKAKLDLQSEVLKVGHHGSHTSSSPLFLDAVAPAYAVISCGRNNRYSHPHDETLDNLTKERHIKLYRTDEQGTIMVDTDGTEIHVHVLGEPETRYVPLLPGIWLGGTRWGDDAILAAAA